MTGAQKHEIFSPYFVNVKQYIWLKIITYHLSLTIKSLVDLNTSKPHVLQSLKNRGRVHVVDSSVGNTKGGGRKRKKKREKKLKKKRKKTWDSLGEGTSPSWKTWAQPSAPLSPWCMAQGISLLAGSIKGFLWKLGCQKSLGAWTPQLPTCTLGTVVPSDRQRDGCDAPSPLSRWSSALQPLSKWSFLCVQGPKKLEIFILPAAICSWKVSYRSREGRIIRV